MDVQYVRQRILLQRFERRAEARVGAEFVERLVRGNQLDVRDSRDAAADFVRDRGLTFDSIYDSPARTLAQLSGYPRNTTPSTLVLDKQHRVAAVYLTQIRIPELIPVVERLVAEPA